MKFLYIFSFIVISHITLNTNPSWAASTMQAPGANAPTLSPATTNSVDTDVKGEVKAEEKKATIPTTITQLALPDTLKIEDEIYFKHTSKRSGTISYMRGSAKKADTNLLHYTFSKDIRNGSIEFHITPAGATPPHIYYTYRIGSSTAPTFLRLRPARASLSGPLQRSLERLSTLFIRALEQQKVF